MYKIDNMFKNPSFQFHEPIGCFTLIEHQTEFEVRPDESQGQYFRNTMHMRRRQLCCDISRSPVAVQNDMFQWSVGEVVVIPPGRKTSTRDVTSKTEYDGRGMVLLKSTYDHIILIDISRDDGWDEQIAIDDTRFVACEAALKPKLVSKTNINSSVSAGRGQYNVILSGKGIVAFSSPVAEENLSVIRLEKDVLKIADGKLLAWSASLVYSLESNEDGSGTNVCVLRGSGRALLLP